MKRCILKIFLLFLIFVFHLISQNTNFKNKKTSGRNEILNYDISHLDINNLIYYFTNYNGQQENMDMPHPSPPPYFLPLLLFQDGPVFSAMVEGSLRVIGSTYNSVFIPGIIKEGRLYGEIDPKTKIYRLRKDWQNDPKEADRIKYQLDYNNWPFDDGAPFEYDGSGKKIPRFIGDQQAWWVMNDDIMNSGRSIGFFGTLSIGTEWQCLAWAYNTPGPLKNTIFKKYKIINKSGRDVLNCYFSYWADSDLGDGTDDFNGSDSTLSLGYTYNGTRIDGVFGTNSPAVGFVLLQGPVVSTNSFNDEANFDFGKKRSYKNLQMSSFMFWDRHISDTNFHDPPLGTIKGGKDMYYNQRGLSKDGKNWIDPKTGRTTTFLLSGDPLERTGWIDGSSNNPPLFPWDRRMMISSGPFNLMKNDTQDVAIAIIVGQGSDRLSSISVLKYYTEYAINFYNNGLEFPKIDIPDIKVYEQSNKIILSWEDKQELYKSIESYNQNGYNFEGYNIYQLPFADSKKTYRIATFDIPNGIKAIYEKELDSLNGAILEKQKQFGNNSGIKREIVIEKDIIRNRNLINWHKYYFAVTAYAFNPAGTPSSIESPLKIIEAIPQGRKSDIEAITVFPNPYYTSNSSGINQYDGYVTFSHLPAKAVIKIFTLSGSAVKTINKNDESQFVKWNLQNDNGIVVSSGMYIAYIDMPELARKKVLKFSVIMESIIPGKI